MSKTQFKPGNMLYPLPVVMVSVADNKGNNNIITVEFKKTKNSLFSKILGKAVYQIETKYEAYNNNNQVIIRKGN